MKSEFWIFLDHFGFSVSLCSIYVSPDVQSKPIEVTVEEPKAQTVRVGSTVSFICTAKSKVNPSKIMIFDL